MSKRPQVWKPALLHELALPSGLLSVSNLDKLSGLNKSNRTMARLSLEFISKSKEAPHGPTAFIVFEEMPLSSNCFSAEQFQKEVEFLKAQLDALAREARARFSAEQKPS